MKPLASLYSAHYPKILAYMLQSTEYQPGPYVRWFWRIRDFSHVMHRRTLERTKAARALLAVLYAGMFLQAASGVALILLYAWQRQPAGWQFGLALLVSYPIVWAHLIIVPLLFGRWLVVGPRQRRAVQRSAQVFAAHPGLRIAVAGSYGKTSMKELLAAVLGSGMKVAATPANKNVPLAHAVFAGSLDGDEDALIIEYGEGAPGDITRFAHQSRPTHAVITGLAAAHLDRYKTVQAAAHDIFSLALAVPNKHLYANAESEQAQAYITKGMQTYSVHGALGWKVRNVMVSIDGVSFTLSKGSRKHKLRSRLLGRHQIGPLAFAAAFAMEQGIDDAAVIAAIADLQPYEHRMQPLQLHGAWMIDDTYNGNIEGIKAGTALLGELTAERKWYVTPGLVDQGDDMRSIHMRMGELIAGAKPDIVVLMRNSAEPFIRAGLRTGAYAGEIRTERDPLAFYTNLPQHLAAGDVVLMQNDWTDNYA